MNDEFFLKPKGTLRARAQVLLLHGFSASPFEVRDCGLHLQKKGYGVSGPCLAGHGGSREAFDSSGLREWIAGAEKAYTSLRKTGKKIILMGHSAGGVLAAMLAEKYQDEVSALIMGAPAFKLASPLAHLSLFPPFRWIKPALHFNSGGAESTHWTQSYHIDRLAELIRLGRLGRESALRLRLPLLMLQARGDDQTSRPFNESLFKKIPSERKKLIIYDTDEHNVFHHSNPLQKQVFGWLDAFLGKLNGH